MKKFILIFLALIVSLLIVDRIFLRDTKNKIVRYDKYLGWSSVPNGYSKDRFGKNVYVKINGQGFRNNKDFDTNIPRGKLRIICSGDSYTFGHGVSNDDVWSEQLTHIDPRLETINMGQVAYGIDQAYLWYLRDGMKFEHDIHLFGIISHDLYRFGKKSMGYNKPILILSQGQLHVANVPVPHKSRMERISDKIKTYFGHTLAIKPVDSEPVDLDLARQMTLKIFENLSKINTTKKSRFVVLFFPMYFVDVPKSANLGFRIFLKRELQKLNIEFIDLTDDFIKLPDQEVKRMFILNKPKDGVHYSAEGNRFVAELIYKYLSPFAELGQN